MDTKKELKTVTSIVEKLLRDSVRCRNDDKWLTFQVMRHFTNIYIPFQDFEKMPSFETVKRVRANIQNKEKRFPPTDPAVIRKRQHRRKEFRQHFGSGGQSEV